MENSRIGTRRWLAIAEEVFVPADSGGRVESLNMLRSVAAAGIDLTVLVPGLGAAMGDHQIALPGVDIKETPRRAGWRSHLGVTPYVFASRPVDPAVLDELRSAHARTPWDAVLAVSFRVAHLGIAVAEALRLPLIVRPHNIESGYFAALAGNSSPVRAVAYRAEAVKLRRAEAVVHRRETVSMFAEISADDAIARRRLTARPVIHVPPFRPPVSTTSTTFAAPERAEPHGVPAEDEVLFLGSLDTPHNKAGIRWFVQRCWPRVRASARLHVVGRRASDALCAELRAGGARVSVDVPDVTPVLARATLFVNPVRAGSGINIKMVEAMAAGLPVVSTTVGARGLDWAPGRHLLVADDEQGFADHVSTLLENASYRCDIARAGHEFVRGAFDGARQVEQMIVTLDAPR